MKRLNKKQIHETFAALGLDNENVRREFRMLGYLGGHTPQRQNFIRLSDSSEGKLEEDTHAQLARTARRD